MNQFGMGSVWKAEICYQAKFPNELEKSHNRFGDYKSSNHIESSLSRSDGQNMTDDKWTIRLMN